MPSRKIAGLYLVSDTSASRGRTHEDVVRGGIAGGAGIVQMRAKMESLRDIYPVALGLRKITREADVLFVVNDSVELAMAVGADGVHLGQDDLPVSVARKASGGRLIIGVSTHSVEEARTALEDGADYIAFGPVFQTGTKDAGQPRGTEMLALVKGEVSIPVVAIGGINPSNARGVIDAGADAIAVVSAVGGAEDISSAARELASLFEGR